MAREPRQYVFDFTKFKNVDVETATVKEIRYDDQARARQVANEKKRPDSWNFELLRMAIVAVDGQKVEYPWPGLDELNQKTVGLLFGAFNEVNLIGADEEETVKGFLKGATPVPR